MALKEPKQQGGTVGPSASAAAVPREVRNPSEALAAAVSKFKLPTHLLSSSDVIPPLETAVSPAAPRNQRSGD
jgi:hypothetical protein